MPRAVNGTIHKNKRKKVLEKAKGFRGGRSKLYRTAKSAVWKAGQSAYRDRRTKRRLFRSLWIIRINAGVRQFGLSYSKFINGLKKANIQLDRKVLAGLAYKHPEIFQSIVEKIKSSV